MKHRVCASCLALLGHQIDAAPYREKPRAYCGACNEPHPARLMRWVSPQGFQAVQVARAEADAQRWLPASDDL